MRISEAGGEAALIQLIQDKYGVSAAGDLALGIGDDAALVRSGDRFIIVTTDLLIENTHFRMDLTDPYLLGWKSAAVNISDIAAMGGVPTYVFVSIGLGDIDTSVVECIYEGIRDVSAKYDSVIAGGDTVASSAGIVINITALGEVEPQHAARRDGAIPGDAIVVTNTLGDSRAGLELLLKYGLDGARSFGSGPAGPASGASIRSNKSAASIRSNKSAASIRSSKRPHPHSCPLPQGRGRNASIRSNGEQLVERHLKPEPRVNEARAAVGTGKVRSMMDLSDGLASDLAKLCEASRVGAKVFAGELPISQELRAGASVLGGDPVELAASGGEDYELLITCAQDDVGGLVRAIEGTGSSAKSIGEIVEGEGMVLVSPDGDEHPMPASWQHF